MNMKKIIPLFIIIVGFTFSVRGQYYQSVIGDSCSKWYIFSVTEDNHAGGTDVRQVIADDTVNMDGTTYYYLRHNCEESYYELPVYNNEPQLLRENESHSKLFFKENYPGISAPEILIMDLDLAIGDTLDTQGWSELIFGGLTTSIPRITIDSCYFLNGRKILRTNYSIAHFTGSIYTLFFIEGVGPTFGPLYPRQKYLFSLSCYYKDDVCLFHGVDYYSHQDCIQGWPAGITESTKDNIKCTIYPNPTFGNCSICVPEGGDITIEIRAITGKIIRYDKFFGNYYYLNFEKYPIGTYFITIKTPTSCNCTKLIKL